VVLPNRGNLERRSQERRSFSLSFLIPSIGMAEPASRRQSRAISDKGPPGDRKIFLPACNVRHLGGE